MALLVNVFNKLTLTLILFIGCFTEANIKNTDTGFSSDIIHRDSIYSPMHDHSLSRYQRALNAIRFSLDSTTMTNPSLKDYLMLVFMGTSSLPVWLIMETSGFLTWMQCSYCVHSCSGNYNTFYDYFKSTTYIVIQCNDDLDCDMIIDGSTCDSAGFCYDGVITINNAYYGNFMNTDTLSFSSATVFDPFYFGCVFDYSAPPNVYGNAAGVASLGNYSYSLINQLDITVFSYCLPSLNSSKNGTIHFGNRALESGINVVSTPLTTKIPSGQANPMYHITLLNFKIGLGYDIVEFPNATSYNDGNIVIDPSTFLSSLPRSMVYEFVAKLEKYIICPRAYDMESMAGLNLCYDVSNCSFVLPPIAANFVGGHICMTQKNIFIEVEEGVQCFTGVSTSSYAIWGSAFQTNFEVGYDLGNHLVKFQSGTCSSY